MNAEPLLQWMNIDAEGVYSVKRIPGTRGLPVPITSFQNCDGSRIEGGRETWLMVVRVRGSARTVR